MCSDIAPCCSTPRLGKRFGFWGVQVSGGLRIRKETIGVIGIIQGYIGIIYDFGGVGLRV